MGVVDELLSQYVGFPVETIVAQAGDTEVHLVYPDRAAPVAAHGTQARMADVQGTQWKGGVELLRVHHLLHHLFGLFGSGDACPEWQPAFGTHHFDVLAGIDTGVVEESGFLVVALDQKINVVILDFDDDKKRIALGLKQLTPHPWDALDPNLKVGDHVKGKVVVIADYGAFVEIAPGVEGLIHVSEMSWSQHLRSAQEFMHVGDEVEAVILTLDREERKMSLGIKQLKEDPWETIEVKYPIGSKHTAKVRNFTNFGIFVELEEGVDGLIHISDLSWTKKVKHPSEFTQVGAEIDVVVLEIDKENRRLSLGHKQLEENPWDTYETIYTPGSILTGKITEIMDKGAVITLNEGGEGFATPKHLVKEDGSQAQPGEELQFKVIEFVKETKRIILSHSRTFEDVKEEPKKAPRAKKAKKEDAPVINNVAAGTTLGDIDALAELKAKMEKGE